MNREIRLEVVKCNNCEIAKGNYDERDFNVKVLSPGLLDNIRSTGMKYYQRLHV